MAKRHQGSMWYRAIYCVYSKRKQPDLTLHLFPDDPKNQGIFMNDLSFSVCRVRTM